MELTQLFKIISENNGSTKKAVEKLNQQKEEIIKSFYIINVLDLTKKIESMVNKKVFQKSNICSCVIQFDRSYSYDSDEPVKHSIKMSFLSLKGKPMNSPYYPEGGESLSSILERFNNYDPSFISEEVNPDNTFDNTYKFELKRGCSKEIFELLLSKKIRLEIDYSKMRNDIDEKTDIEQKPINKKLKI